jgi:hypothetical protein
MFAHSAPEQKRYTKVLFVSFNKKDPSKEFISRFEDHTLPVKKASDSEVSTSSEVHDKDSGEQGILFNVGEIKQVSDAEVLVAGSFYVANLFGGGCEYRVVLTEGKWVVKGCGGKRWIS